MVLTVFIVYGHGGFFRAYQHPAGISGDQLSTDEEHFSSLERIVVIDWDSENELSVSCTESEEL